MIRLATPSPALVIDGGGGRVLVVADLHIGFEHEMAEKGVFIPSQTYRIKEKLLKTIDRYRPSRLVMLGDVKHKIPRISMGEWKDIPEFFEEVGEKVEEISVILGNHDGNLEPLLPHKVKILRPTGEVISDSRKVGLFHGHAWPSAKVLSADFLVMGHVHPAILFRGAMGFRAVKQVWVRADCDGGRLAEAAALRCGGKRRGKKTSEGSPRDGKSCEAKRAKLILMPAFNEMLGGLPLNLKYKDNYVGPVLNSGVVNIEEADIYLLDGTYLGPLFRLRPKVGAR